ncbi:Uncharacterized protein OBRU01_06219 [Operophtera brumata]|uniref:Uncharacterized protein n=1 Tax=Operophtera brumata TaxID=104452 RepID=A0A0L7LLN7_OPEBR|nr:Uncharacterized protein OBRU01_06219 [Operophtera brumata]
MPPRIRTRATKDLKENVHVVKKTKVKSDGKITKLRKALSDKNNSLSDDNASIDVPIKTSKVALKNKAPKTISNDGARPRRVRRLPTRYIEPQVLNNLSNEDIPLENQASVISITGTSHTKPLPKHEKVQQPPPRDNKLLSKNEEVKLTTNRPNRKCLLQSSKEPETVKTKPPIKQNHCISSPVNTPSQCLDSSLITHHPKRICKLPPKYHEFSISPNKFIPLHPSHASTPIVQKKAKALNNENVTKLGLEKRRTRKDKKENNNDENTKGIEHYLSKSSKRTAAKYTSVSSKDKTSPDTNNNPKVKRTLTKRVISTKSPTKSPKASTKTDFGKRLLDKSFSFRVLEDRKSQDKDQDVYEFTFDPNEEPTPKKKRKKVVRKRPPKPKTVVLKNNYDKNVQLALNALKSKIKPSQHQNKQHPQTQSVPTNVPTVDKNTVCKMERSQPQNTQHPQTQSLPTNVQTVNKNTTRKITIIEDITIKPAAENKSLNDTPSLPVNESAKSIHMSNYASIRVEDIAADFEQMDNDEINYSPVNSPCHATPEIQENESHIIAVSKDPLNLQGDTSFFDEQPVASSSMNASARHPLASPWRVEFGNLPVRWQADTYVKPNMTPAVESSFINSEEISKKKHVYTNLLAEEPFLQDDGPNLKQTSIISFMREVAERSLKKKRARSVSPTKANSLFEDMTNTDVAYKTSKKAKKDNVPASPNASNSSNDTCEKENSNENNENHNENSIPKENLNLIEESPAKKSKKKLRDDKFFGFDESERYDQENVSPVKNIQHAQTSRGLRAKSRAVLQEVNALCGPTRAVLPVTVISKLASSDVVEKLYEQLKSADDAPQFPEKGIEDDKTADDEPLRDDDDSHPQEKAIAKQRK